MKGTAMRGHGPMMWICAAMIAAALVLVILTDNAAYVLPAAGCVLMMGAMMWLMMGRPGSHGGRSAGGR